MMADPDPLESLRHIRTLVRIAMQSNDADTVQKLLGEMQRVIDKALLDKRKTPRS